MALALVLLVLLGRVLVGPEMGRDAPFLLFFGAVVISAWFGGLGPGLFATVSSAAAAFTLHLVPFDAALDASVAGVLPLAIFVFEGLLVSVSSQVLQVHTRRVERDKLAIARKEALLRLSEERYRMLVDGVRDYALFTIDADGNVAGWNSGAERILGYGSHEIIGQHLSCFYPQREIDAGRPTEELLGALRLGRLETEGVRIRRDGMRFPALVTMARLLDEARNVVGFSCVVRDLTERTQAEARYRMLVDGAKEYALFMLDASGRVSGWNAGAERLTGYRSDEVLGREIGFLRLPEDPRQGGELDLARRDGRYEDEGWRLRRDGGRFWANLVVSRLRDEDGHVPGFSVLLRDLTDRKRLEDELQERAAELADANRIKDEFLATLSHELRTPLNAILGWIHLIRTRNLDGKQVARGLETVERSARQQSQLIDDLLDVSRIITGKLRMNARAMPVAPVVESAIEAVRPAAAARKISIETRLSATDAEVFGDPDRVQQIVWNLLSNAIKFTPEGGHVEVTLDQHGGCARVLVEDDGEGISPSFLPLVFQRFRQANSSNTRRHGGLGRGLGIVRHLVELHGGAVQAESAGPGLGAKFTVELPLLGANHRPCTPESTVSVDSVYEEAPLTGLRVLVVDDEPDARELLAMVLEQGGAEVEAVGSADAAFEAYQSQRPDVLVSDIAMPGADGYSLIERVRSHEECAGGSVPAVALTAYARVEDRRRALQAGFQVHMAKPIEPRELTEKVAKLAGRAPSADALH